MHSAVINEEVLRDLWPEANGRPKPAAPAPAEAIASWESEFHGWTTSRCIWREKCFGGIRCLHRDFAAYCLELSVPCNLAIFERLFVTEGFSITNGLVYGLLPAADFPETPKLASTNGRKRKP